MPACSAARPGDACRRPCAGMARHRLAAAEGLVRAGGDLPADDLAFAGRLLGALVERRLACLPDGAVAARGPGRAGGPGRRDRRAPAGRGGARAGPRPAPACRRRDGARRRGPAHGGGRPPLAPPVLPSWNGASTIVPAAVLDRARDAESDAALKGTIASLAEAAALSSPDPVRRRAAIAAVAASPSGAAAARLERFEERPCLPCRPGLPGRPRCGSGPGPARGRDRRWSRNRL